MAQTSVQIRELLATIKLVDYFSSTQLGVGIPEGYEAAVHAITLGGRTDTVAEDVLPSNTMDNALGARCDDLDRAISRLKLFSAHDALLFLRPCFSASKIMHILRCSPCSDHRRLLQFDLSIR